MSVSKQDPWSSYARVMCNTLLKKEEKEKPKNQTTESLDLTHMIRMRLGRWENGEFHLPSFLF